MTPTLDDAFRALADPERRRLLTALVEHNPQPDGGMDVYDAIHSKSRREQLHIEMYHGHLPQLEDAGLIKWNRDTGEVTKGPRFDEIRPVLHLLIDDPENISPHE